MTGTASSFPRRQSPRVRIAALVMVVMLAAVMLGGCGGQAAAPPPLPATPTIDTQLILRPHVVPVHGTLAGGVQVSGTLSPSLQGANTLKLRVHWPTQHRIEHGTLSLVITMLGMKMIPVKAKLTSGTDTYSGTILLPMFGTYRAEAVLATPAERYAGRLTLTVSLLLGR